MAESFAPSAGQAVRATLAPALTRLYLVDNGTEFEFSLTGPAEASLTLNAFGEYEVDEESTAKLAKAADGTLIVY